MEKVLSHAKKSDPIQKRVSLKPKQGGKLTIELSLQDERGKQSAADFIEHLYVKAKDKLGDPVVHNGFQLPNPYDQEAMKKQIIFISSFHDSMFGSFSEKSTLPDEERSQFLEVFFLAIGTVIDGNQILVDLEKGKITAK